MLDLSGYRNDYQAVLDMVCNKWAEIRAEIRAVIGAGLSASAFGNSVSAFGNSVSAFG